MYENGSESMISMLLSADSIADLLNKQILFRMSPSMTGDMLESLVKVREGIETQEDDLKSQETELADLKGTAEQAG